MRYGLNAAATLYKDGGPIETVYPWRLIEYDGFINVLRDDSETSVGPKGSNQITECWKIEA